PDALVVVLDRAIPVLHVVVDQPAVLVSVGIIRFQPDRLVEVRYGLFRLAQPAPGIAAIVVGQRVVGRDAGRLVIVLDRALILIERLEDVAAVVECRGVVRPEPQRLIVVLQRLLVVLLVLIADAAVVVGDRQVLLALLAALDDGGAAADRLFVGRSGFVADLALLWRLRPGGRRGECEHRCDDATRRNADAGMLSPKCIPERYRGAR